MLGQKKLARKFFFRLFTYFLVVFFSSLKLGKDENNHSGSLVLHYNRCPIKEHGLGERNRNPPGRKMKIVSIYKLYLW